MLLEGLGSILAAWMLGAPCPPSPPAGAATAWVSTEDADSAVGWLSRAQAASEAGACEVAIEALSRWSDGCRAYRCDRAAEPATQVEARCLVDAAGVDVPAGGRLVVDVEAPRGRLVVGRRLLTYVLADGRRFARPLCVQRGVPPVVAFDAPDAPLAPLEGDAEARASALGALARVHRERAEWCPAATLYEALAHLPRARYNAALAHTQREGGCGDAAAVFAGLIAEAPSDLIVERAREQLEALRATCTATLLIVGPDEGAQITIDGAPPAPASVAAGGLRCRPETTLVTDLWPGLRRVELTEAGQPTRVTWVGLRAGDDAVIHVPERVVPPPPPPPDTTLGWLWAPVAATGLGLTAGVVFTVLAEGDRDAHAQAARDAQRDPSRSYLADQRAALDAFDRDRAIAYVGWGLAASGAAVFAVGWALDDVEGEVVATGDGLRVEGRF